MKEPQPLDNSEQMPEEGYVSLWLGVAPSRDALERYVQLRYDSDGEIIPSAFMREWNLPSWDESFREAEVLASPTTSIDEILNGFSYDDQIISAFRKLTGRELDFEANAVVLLYDFRHSSPVAVSTQGDVQLRFIGATKYGS